MTLHKPAPVAFALGDAIRAQDFEPRQDRGDCYVEGVIVAIDRARGGYSIRCTRDVYDGVDEKRETVTRVARLVFVPFEVVREWPGRVAPVAVDEVPACSR